MDRRVGNVRAGFKSVINYLTGLFGPPGSFSRVPEPLPPVVKVQNGVHQRFVSDPTKPRFVVPNNVFDILVRGRDLSGNGPCVGKRTSKTGKYEWLSYQGLIDRATKFGAGLVALGGKPGCEYLVGIVANTSLEWTVAEYGCFAYGMATAPFSESLGPEISQEIINRHNLEIVVCGTDEQIVTILGGSKFPLLPNKLRTIITIGQLKPGRTAQIEKLGVNLLTMSQVEELGARNPRPWSLATKDSLASLMFTSGTTGMPKGAMLTHSCFLLQAKSFAESSYPLQFNTDITALGVYPLSHVFERGSEKLVHLHGGKVGYLSEDITGLVKDAQELRPTIFLLVPRIMNRLYDEINTAMQRSFPGRILLPVALAAKHRAIQKGIFRRNTVWDLLLFRKCQAVLGGNVQAIYAGAAACDGVVLDFIRAVFGCYVFEMYGQTETSGPVTCTTFGDLTTGHVGVPLVDVEVKLVDVPEMGYFAVNQCGEICSRAKFTMRGYYNMPSKTAEALDAEGWLHTGDIGSWTEDGKLRIFDRKKHIFKLNQGEYLAPERLEGIFGRSNLITNIFIDGDSLYSYAVALIYPNFDALGITPSQINETGREADARAKIMNEMVRLGKENKLRQYEIPKKIVFLEEPFSLENNCLTPSQKTKRDTVRALHRNLIRDMYEAN